MRLAISGAAVLLAGLVQSSYGAIITNGSFSIAGNIYVTDNTGVTIPGVATCPVNESCIFWTDSANTLLNKADISSGGLPNGDIPASIAGNDAGNISTLMNPPEAVGTFPAQQFFSFVNGGVTTVLDINDIVAGFEGAGACSTDTTAAHVGQVCTPPGSLFNFVNNPPPNTSGASCTVSGSLECQATATWVFEGITNTSGVTWTGNFTSQFPSGDPYQQVLSNLENNHYVTNTYSATITLTPAVSTPEPGTMGLMIGSGLIALGVGLRRLRTSKG